THHVNPGRVADRPFQTVWIPDVDRPAHGAVELHELIAGGESRADLQVRRHGSHRSMGLLSKIPGPSGHCGPEVQMLWMMLAVGWAQDADQDGVLDADDTCPEDSNDDQADRDDDGSGDACDVCFNEIEPTGTNTD